MWKNVLRNYWRECGKFSNKYYKKLSKWGSILKFSINRCE